MTPQKKLSITQWAQEDRPREKFLAQGAKALTNAELVAILLGSGNATENAVDLAKRMLTACGGDLTSLFAASGAKLMEFNGIGEAKATTLCAAAELARRYNAERSTQAPVYVRSSDEAHRVLAPLMAGLPHEEFWVITLNTKKKVIGASRVMSGGLDTVGVDRRLVFGKALEDKASGIIVAHNHPSGDPTPSNADRQLTQKLAAAGETLGIPVFDHIVVGGDRYYSFADEEEM